MNRVAPARATVLAALGAGAVVNLAGTVVDVHRRSLLADPYLRYRVDDATLLESFVDRLATATVVLTLVLAAAFGWFFHQARAVIGRRAPLAGAAFLIPIANLWLPYQVADRLLAGRAHRLRNVWWGAFVGAAAAALRSRSLFDAANDRGDLGGIRTALAIGIAGNVLLLVAIVASVLIVERITAEADLPRPTAPAPLNP